MLHFRIVEEVSAEISFRIASRHGLNRFSASLFRVQSYDYSGIFQMRKAKKTPRMRGFWSIDYQ
jgi:hypothetical protein